MNETFSLCVRKRVRWLIGVLSLLGATGSYLFFSQNSNTTKVPGETTAAISRSPTGSYAHNNGENAQHNTVRVHVSNPNLFAIAPLGHSGYLAVGSDGQILRITADSTQFEVIDTDTSVPLSGVACDSTTLTCLAYGAEGTLLRSTDLGRHFQAVPIQTKAALRALSYAVERDGVIVVGERGTLLLSRDNGASFSQQQTTEPVNGFLGHAVFLTKERNWIVGGENGVLLRSEANKPWQVLPYPNRHLITSLCVLPDGALLVSDETGSINRSTDNGHSFTLAKDQSSTGYVTAMATNSTDRSVVAVTSNGQILRSSDGGVGFTIVGQASGNPYLATVQPLNHLGYLIAGNEATLYSLEKGGAKLVPIPVTDGGDIESAVNNWSRSESIVVGKGGFIARVDEVHKTTVTLSAANTRHMNAVAYHAKSDSLIAVGTDEGAARSLDGGKTWQPMTLPVEDGTTLFSIAVSAKTGTLLVAGTGAVLLRSTDAGRSFTKAIGGMSAISKVEALTDGQFVAAPVDEGVIYSEDDGKTFTLSVMDPGISIVAFARTERHLLAIGLKGALFYSGDKGRRFTRSKSDCEVDLNAGAVSPSTVVVVGEQGQIYRSLDEGESFASVESGVDENLLSVEYGTAQGTFIAVGNSGTVLASVDQGASWQRVGPHITERMRLVFVDPFTHQFVLLGHAGSLLTSKDGKQFALSTNHTRSKYGAYTFHPPTQQIIVAGERLLRLGF